MQLDVGGTVDFGFIRYLLLRRVHLYGHAQKIDRWRHYQVRESIWRKLELLLAHESAGCKAMVSL